MKRSTFRFGALATVAVIAAALFVGGGPSAQSTPPPFTFYLTHYELLGDMNNPSGVRYHSNGAPFAKARDGSSIAFTGQGAWDPASRRATGAGTYVIKNRSGAVKRKGTWRATRFISFRQLPGWWGIENFRGRLAGSARIGLLLGVPEAAGHAGRAGQRSAQAVVPDARRAQAKGACGRRALVHRARPEIHRLSRAGEEPRRRHVLQPRNVRRAHR
jgi:hypothetical protein